MGLARCEAPLTAHNEKREAFRVSGGCGIVPKILSAVQEETILLHKEGDIIMRKLLARKILRVWLLAVVCAAGMSFAARANQTVTLAVSSGENITKQFNKASREAVSKSGTTTIVIPPGVYWVDQLKVWGHTTVSMEGVTLFNADGAHSMLRFGAKSTDWDEYNNGAGRGGYSADFSDISFQGGTWDNFNCPTCIMQIGHSQNLSFTGVTFRNVNTSHHLEFGACQNVRITNCTFTGYSGDFGDAYNGEAIQFEILSGVAKKHFGGYNPLTDETPCKNVEISGCTFDGLKRGVGSHTAIANSYFTGFRIHDNTFRNITGYAVSMMNYKDSSVYNNTITQCGAGILCAASERSHSNFYASALFSNRRSAPMNLNCQIYNNVLSIDPGANGALYNNENYGIWVFGEKLKKKKGTIPPGDWRACGVTVRGNRITMNTSGSGILLTGAKGVTVSGNTVTCGKGRADGIKVTLSGQIVLRKNTVRGAGKRGIRASGRQLKTNKGNKVS